MKKRYWMIAVLTLILLAAIVLPACAKKEAAPAPTLAVHTSTGTSRSQDDENFLFLPEG